MGFTNNYTGYDPVSGERYDTSTPENIRKFARAIESGKVLNINGSPNNLRAEQDVLDKAKYIGAI